MRKIWIVLIVMVLGVSCFGLGLVFALWLNSEEPTAEVTTTVPRSEPSSTAIPEVTATVPRSEPSGATITWHSCNDKSIDSEDSDKFDCGTVDVPLDYAQPDGEKISIALIRLRASGSRSGAILYNPGGPGGSGFDYVASMGQTYVDELTLEEYDFVGLELKIA
jgi:hypothetical protein